MKLAMIIAFAASAEASWPIFWDVYKDIKGQVTDNVKGVIADNVAKGTAKGVDAVYGAWEKVLGIELQRPRPAAPGGKGSRGGNSQSTAPGNNLVCVPANTGSGALVCTPLKPGEKPPTGFEPVVLPNGDFAAVPNSGN